MTRRACHAGTGAALPFSVCSPAGSKAIDASAARIVASPTRTVPGAAADCSRAAVLTRSPATMPSFVAPRVTAASPVSTPTRAWIPGPSPPTAVATSRPARTARSASSSWAIGVPQAAITASPMNFSTTPPWRSMMPRVVSKYCERSSRTASGSRSSENVVKPTRSANRIVTSRRSAPRSAPVPGR